MLSEDDTEDSYDGYVSAIYAGLLSPNHTEYGYGLTRAPTDLVTRIQNEFNEGVEDAEMESNDSAIDVRSKFVELSEDLEDEALGTLRPILEAWSGKQLVPTSAYGLRVYQHNASLLMHLVESSTHVISAILHIGHDDPDKNWPLAIEVS